MKLVYDPSVDVSYPLFICPTCGAEFYGGGPARHERDCPKAEYGYVSVETHFGDQQIARVREMAEKFGPEHTWHGISLSMLVSAGIIES